MSLFETSSIVEEMEMPVKNSAEVPKNSSRAKSDIHMALGAEHGHHNRSGRSSTPSLHSLPAPTILPSLPTPEQRKKLLYRNVKGLQRPQGQQNNRNGFTGRESKAEKWNKGQLHPPVLSSSKTSCNCNEDPSKKNNNRCTRSPTRAYPGNQAR